jgi:nitrogenase molybdenum-iron protein beta chain
MSQITEMPRGSCALGGANTVFSSIHRVIPIYHSGPGCCMQTSAGTSFQSGFRSPASTGSVHTALSNMLENEVIFGGLDRLRDEVDGALEIYDADAFFVLTGCTAGIIGDDVKQLAEGFRAQGAPVYAVESPGFLGDTFRGFEIALDALANQIIEKRPKQKGLVNLLGIVPFNDAFWEGTLEEYTRIFKELGLTVNSFFTDWQDIETVRNAGAAELNVILSPWLLKGFERTLAERFDVPSLRWHSTPIGAAETSELVRAVGAALGLNSRAVEQVVTQEERYVYRYLEQILGALSWKRFAVVGNTQSVVALTRFLANSCGFTPEVAIVTDPLFRDEDFAAVRAALCDLEYEDPPAILFESDQYRIEQALLAHPDISLLLGGSADRYVANLLDAQFIAAVFPITDRLLINRTYYGYRGSLTFIEDIFDNL